MPQIQYPAYTQPPAFTLPTVAQMGWPAYEPSDVLVRSRNREDTRRYPAAQHAQGVTVFALNRWADEMGWRQAHNPADVLARSRNQEDTRRYPAAQQAKIVNVFAVEQWLVTSATTDIGHSYGPTSPLQFINRRDYRARGGGYQLWPSAMPWDMTQPSTSVPYPPMELPDDPRLGRRTMLSTAVLQDAAVSGWPGSEEQLRAWLTYPDTTRRGMLAIAEHLAYVTGTSPEEWDPPALSWRPEGTARVPMLRPQTRIDGFTFALQDLTVVVPPNSWAGEYPDTTRRALLTVARLPFVFRGEAVEQFARILLASVTAPDTTRRARALTDGAVPSVALVLQALTTAGLTWDLGLPDGTTRNALPVSRMPSTFRGEAIENFARKLLASVTFPDTTRRHSLAIADLPFLFRTQEIVRALVGIVTYPVTTRRASLPTASMPFVFKGEAIEQFRRVLLASATYPDTTTRRSLSVTEHPWLALMLGIAPRVPEKDSWTGYQPMTTRRNALTTDQHPVTTPFLTFFVNPAGDFIIRLGPDDYVVRPSGDDIILMLAADDATVRPASDDATIRVKPDDDEVELP